MAQRRFSFPPLPQQRARGPGRLRGRGDGAVRRRRRRRGDGRAGRRNRPARRYRTQENLFARRARRRRRLSGRREAGYLHAALRAQGEECAKRSSGGPAGRRPRARAGRAALRALEVVIQRLMDTRVDKRNKAAILGTGKHRYRVVENWAKLPDEWEFKDVAAVAVDSKDRVYCFNRGEHPMMVFDREGNFIRSWGEGTFPRAHGLHIDANDILYCTDDGGHVVRKCTTEGKVLLELGVPGKPAPYMSGTPFHRCTHTALSPRGDIYVSDGYGNARVHKFSPDGKLLMSWGEPGTGEGEFNIVHNICCDPDGWLYVADRENHRVQVFDDNGRFETEWNNMHRPNGMCIATGRDPLIYIGEGGPSGEINRDWPNIGPRVSIHTVKGKVLARLGKMHAGLAPGGTATFMLENC